MAARRREPPECNVQQQDNLAKPLLPRSLTVGSMEEQASRPTPTTLSLQKVEGSNPFSRFRKDQYLRALSRLAAG
jgi:hypothetical protein